MIRVAAWAMITRSGGDAGASDAVLAQFRAGESFYRLPGGTVEEGETSAEACVRELLEEAPGVRLAWRTADELRLGDASPAELPDLLSRPQTGIVHVRRPSPGPCG